MRQFKQRLVTLIIVLTAILAGGEADAAIKFNLDTIASWGKFPRFCVNTYRWGDKFFNGYDTAYVDPTGYRFNIKAKIESWSDMYRPKFENNASMTMLSDPSTSLGFYLTYMAVSVGYDINVSKYFGGSSQARKRWQFGFNCMLFAADLYLISNDVGTRIKSYQPPGESSIGVSLPFDGINTSEWGFNLYYFFNHKKYSQAAAFNFSRIQKRSGGSFFAGIAFTKQNFNFDFGLLPDEIKSTLPDDLDNMNYTVNCHNYAVQGGYGYNWVFRPNWNWGVTIAPMVGWTDGMIVQQNDSRATFAMLVRARTGVVWNHRQWFAAGVLSYQGTLIGSRQRNLLTSYFTFEVSAGFRFNLW